MTMTMEVGRDGRFWNLGRLSILLQVILVALVIFVLVISMRTLVTQSVEFGREAEERARAAEQATVRNREAIHAVTCILLIHPDIRTAELVESECGVEGIFMRELP